MAQLSPPRVLKINLTRLDPVELYGEEPYANQPWKFRAYFNVGTQTHGDPRTPRPSIYNGLDVSVNDYITTQSSKILRITAVESKTSSTAVCIVEDGRRLNSSIDTAQGGESAIETGHGLLFTVLNGFPVLYPLPDDIQGIDEFDLVGIIGRFFYAGEAITGGYTGSVGYTGSSTVNGYTGSAGFVGSAGSAGYVGSAGYLGSTGYTGSIGPQGTAGYTGSQGADGVRGYFGYTGSSGYAGSRGLQGLTGPKGDTGYVGSQGIPGTAAAVGYTGSQGADGYVGSYGYTGSVGPKGSVGFVGSRGETGYVGSGGLGYTGSRGTDGIAGYTGSKGDQGLRGYFGYTGSSGYAGSRGLQGLSGAKGELGYTGSQGIPGTAAAVGYTGSASTEIGYTGSAGAGYTGSAGVDGVIGRDGYTGSVGIGYAGSQGVIGYTGSAGTGAGSDNLVWTTDGSNRLLTGYKEDNTTYTIRTADFFNNKLRLVLATFTPTLASAGLSASTLNWDVAATGFSVTVTNPSDVTDQFISSVESLTQVAGSVSLLGTFTPGAYSATPAGGVSWNRQFIAAPNGYIRSTSTTISGGNSSGTVQFRFFNGTADVVYTAATSTWSITWATPTTSASIPSLSGQTFLTTYTSVSYTVSVTGITTSSNYVHNIVPTGGTVSSATGNGTLTFTDPIHKNNTGTTRSISNTTTFTRPAAVTGTQYTAQLASSATVPVATFTYPTVWLWTSSTSTPPTRDDIIVGTGFESTVTQIGNQVKVLSGFVNNTAPTPRGFWFAVRTAASQPTTFRTGASSSLLSDVTVTTGNTVQLAPDVVPAGYIAEPYTLYGITLQPGNTYVSIS